MRGVLVAVLAFLIAAAAVSAPASASSGQPIAFTKNMGQWPDSILFRADAGGAVMWFVKNGIYYQYTKRMPRPRSGEEALTAGLGPRQIDPADRLHQEPDSIETTMIKAEFVGSNPDVEVIGLEELDYKCNYFLGNDPTKWRTDVPNYSSVMFKGLYPGVDASIGGRDGRLECRLTAASSADVEQVRTAYLCNGAVTKETENRVSIQTPVGEKRFAGILPLDENGSAGATVTSAGSPNAGVSIAYSTYLGGASDEYGLGIAVDGSGCTYVTGYTYSADFPTATPYQTDQGFADVFVSKISESGNSLIYSTYLGGGNQSDLCYGVAVDGSGNAYVTGYTYSSDFPTANPYQTFQGGSNDVFVTKLSAAGNSLVYSTYLGGANADIGWGGIVVDASGFAYVTGSTNSPGFPTSNPYQAYQGDGDVFVTKFSVGGNSLVYSTYLGGNDYDSGFRIAVDGSGCAYVTGWTYSSDFPIVEPYQNNQDTIDVFVTKLSASGSNLIFSTYLGGSNTDYGYGIAVDGSGCAYVTGATASSNFPTANPYQLDQGNRDAFVAKLSSGGDNLIYGTYLGGSAVDVGHGIAIDGNSCAYVTGWTGSSNFPTANSYQTYQGAGDTFVTRISESGSSLTHCSYLGGSSEDGGEAVALDGSGNAYITGWTLSSDFPTASPYQTDQGGPDVFVTKLMFVSCCVPDFKLRGDFSNGGGAFPNGDGITDGSDLQTCVDYVFFNDISTLVDCLESQDVNDDLLFDGGDLGILVDYIFFNDTSVIKRCDGSPF